MIAENLMTPHIHMLHSSATLKEVVDMMNKQKISAIFFHEESQGKYFIITHTDILNLLGNGKLETRKLEDIKASEIMNGPVKMIDSSTPVDSVIRFFETHKYKRTLVSRKGKAIGVLSLSDIREWMFNYFKAGKPQILLIIDTKSGILIGKHIFKKNIDEKVDSELIELYGGALTSITHMTNEVFGRKNEMRNFVGDKYAILFEELFEVTGILICTEKSIELHQKLHKATYQFYAKYQQIIKSKGLKSELDLSDIVKIFEK
jgi:CBS domain-containing protein